MIGIIYGDALWFVKATPLNLSLSFILLILNTKLNKKVFYLVIACFFTGMFA